MTARWPRRREIPHLRRHRAAADAAARAGGGALVCGEVNCLRRPASTWEYPGAFARERTPGAPCSCPPQWHAGDHRGAGRRRFLAGGAGQRDGDARRHPRRHPVGPRVTLSAPARGDVAMKTYPRRRGHRIADAFRAAPLPGDAAPSPCASSARARQPAGGPVGGQCGRNVRGRGSRPTLTSRARLDVVPVVASSIAAVDGDRRRAPMRSIRANAAPSSPRANMAASAADPVSLSWMIAAPAACR